MCQNQPRRSVSRVIVAHVSAVPLDKCVYEFVHVSANLCMFQRGFKVLIFVFINKRLSTHDLDLAVHGSPRLDRTLVKKTLWRLVDAAVKSESESDESSDCCALKWTSRTRACS